MPEAYILPADPKEAILYAVRHDPALFDRREWFTPSELALILQWSRPKTRHFLRQLHADGVFSCTLSKAEDYPENRYSLTREWHQKLKEEV